MNAVKKNLVIISGGPGTGKTYTAAKILGLLTFGRLSSDKDRMIALAAPTGKAAPPQGNDTELQGFISGPGRRFSICSRTTHIRSTGFSVL
jgi:exodeoxyribonuclease V alpha subunit